MDDTSPERMAREHDSLIQESHCVCVLISSCEFSFKFNLHSMGQLWEYHLRSVFLEVKDASLRIPDVRFLYPIEFNDSNLQLPFRFYDGGNLGE